MEENVKDMQVLLQAMKGDHLGRGEFTKAFKDLVDVLVETRKTLTEEIKAKNGYSKTETQQLLIFTETTLKEAITEIKNQVTKLESSLRSDTGKKIQTLETNLGEIKRNIPPRYDDRSILDELKNIRISIPKVPDNSELLLKIKELEKEIDELKNVPKGGGGVTNLRIIQAFKYILKTEAPVGAINGSNTTYTVSQPIFAVLSFSINGETIAELPNYTISNKTITFSSALPAAYSGKDFECKYI